MPKANAQPRTDVKDALTAAAVELIAEVGWGRVSSRMVAERAGVNNALVHYHFGSMEELLRRAAGHVLEQAFTAPTRGVWAGDDVDEGMRRAVRWIDRLDVHGADTAVLLETLIQCRRDSVLQEQAAGQLVTLRAELARALGDDAGTATLLLALLDGLLLHRAIDPSLRLTSASKALGALLDAPHRTEATA